jgi:hypothetical protein
VKTIRKAEAPNIGLCIAFLRGMQQYAGEGDTKCVYKTPPVNRQFTFSLSLPLPLSHLVSLFVFVEVGMSVCTYIEMT